MMCAAMSDGTPSGEHSCNHQKDDPLESGMHTCVARPNTNDTLLSLKHSFLSPTTHLPCGVVEVSSSERESFHDTLFPHVPFPLQGGEHVGHRKQMSSGEVRHLVSIVGITGEATVSATADVYRQHCRTRHRHSTNHEQKKQAPKNKNKGEKPSLTACGMLSFHHRALVSSEKAS